MSHAYHNTVEAINDMWNGIYGNVRIEARRPKTQLMLLWHICLERPTPLCESGKQLLFALCMFAWTTSWSLDGPLVCTMRRNRPQQLLGRFPHAKPASLHKYCYIFRQVVNERGCRYCIGHTVNLILCLRLHVSHGDSRHAAELSISLRPLRG